MTKVKSASKPKAKKETLKVIYHLYASREDGGGDIHVFFDENKIVHSLNASDSPFNKYEFEPLFDHLGVKIVDLETLNSKQTAALKDLDKDLEPG